MSRIDLNLLSFYLETFANALNRERWKIILHHLTKLHAFIGNVANALRITEKSCNAFKPFICVEQCIMNVWDYKNIHIRMWHMQHHSTIFFFFFFSLQQ